VVLLTGWVELTVGERTELWSLVHSLRGPGTAEEILAKVRLVQTNIKKLVDNNTK
jgi:hypothetical protein